MTLPAWPEAVPHVPIRGSFQLVSNQPPLKTDMDGGNTRLRKQYTVTRSTVAYSLKMSSAALLTFKEFWHSDLADGAGRFTAPIFGPGGCLVKTCQASDGTFKAVPTAGGWIVSLQLEVEAL